MRGSSSRTACTRLAPLVLAALLAPFAGAPLAARADDQVVVAPAGAAVARISVADGSVALRRGDSETQTAAVVNAPVIAADYVTTGAASRAEIQLDGASMVRLGANAQIRFARLDSGDRELQVAEGTVDYRVLRALDGRAQIDTPSVAVRPRAAGSYRVTVDAEGRTLVTVRSGVADVVTPSGAQPLAPGTTLYAQGAASNPSLQRLAAVALDDFDRFNEERDARELRALADVYAPPGVAGIDDLDAYGRWTSDTTYGTVWVPSYVSPGWAPYRDGRWTWEDGFGWTWIGAERWGWAPYHYGRWFHHPRRGWCWVPARAVVGWSPGLVSFLSFGSGFGTIGWVPLAPFEPFLPWWGAGGTTIVTIDNFYPNRHHGRWFFANMQHGGATEIPKRKFLEGRFKPVAMTPVHMRSVEVVRGQLPLVPTDANLRFSDRPVASALAVRPAFAQRAFAGEGVTVHRVPIEQQRAAIATHVVPPAPHTAVTVQHAADPWSRFGSNRAAPGSHGVTVIDGTATTNATGTTSATGIPAGKPARAIPVNSRHGAGASDAWSRFDASSPSRSATERAPVMRQPVMHDASAGAAAQSHAAPVRTYEAPHADEAPPRTYEPRREAPAPPPHQPQNSAPAQQHATPSRASAPSPTGHHHL